MSRFDSLRSSIRFAPGAKVVCVNDAFDIDCSDRCSSLPVKGRVYVISRSEIWGGKLGIAVIGIRMFLNTTFGVPYLFMAERFRLLEELKLESAQRINTLATASQVAG